MDEDYEAGAETAVAEDETESRESDTALAQRLLRNIKADKHHHRDAFKQMKADMKLARTGRVPGWSEEKYTANIIGRHVRTKTEALYAKNPKAVAGRRETLDFALWDENPDTLMMAYQTVQQAQTALASMPPTVLPGGVIAPPQMPPEVQQAQALLADAQQGMARREQIRKTGVTLQALFAYAMDEQQPVDFKTSMKKLVRRACTTGVGYVEVCFEREMGTAPEIIARMDDAKMRLARIKTLIEEAAEGDIDADEAEAAELQRTIDDLMSQQEIILREGLVFDFPVSTRVIPDKNCESLVGFQGSDHLTIEYLYTKERVNELFGVDIGKGYTPYEDTTPDVSDDYEEKAEGDQKKNDLVCVYKYYDKLSGLVYYLADGHHGFLREPAAPDVFVEGFWPVYALTFNEVEDEDSLFPPSDAQLLYSMQEDYNKSRQGKREHRYAARPRWVYANGALEETDASTLASAPPFSVNGMNLGPNQKLADVLEAINVPGVDPNLYDTGEIFSDVQLVGGSQEANYGGLAKATATESAIAASATAASDSTAVDDLDSFLTRVVRASGQIMLREMSTETVQKIVGVGAVWPEGVSLSDIAEEIYLKVEAGSSGKPNQAVEVKNWQMMLPFLVQMPGVNPLWVAKETVRRLDDKADITEAIAAGIPSIVAQNAMQQPGPADPGANPTAQGPEGAQNAPSGPAEQQAGSDPAFGSNQV